MLRGVHLAVTVLDQFFLVDPVPPALASQLPDHAHGGVWIDADA